MFKLMHVTVYSPASMSCNRCRPSAGRLAYSADWWQHVLQVLPQDWQGALTSSPAPSSLRSGWACLAPAAEDPVPHPLAPLLLPALARALCALRRQAWPLPPAASLAADTAECLLTRSLRLNTGPEVSTNVRMCWDWMPSCHLPGGSAMTTGGLD